MICLISYDPERNSMNIQEATKKALDAGGMIFRKDEAEKHGIIVKLQPTNSYMGFVIYTGKGFIGCKWNPKISDLLSTEWEVTE